MWEYVCHRRFVRRETNLNRSATNTRYHRRPDSHIQASDDPGRPGRIDAEVILAVKSPILLGWDALNGDTPFEQTRLTRLEALVQFDLASLFTAESPSRRVF